ncbi:hypothetical protein ACFSKM_01825 [Ancylobacter dichloromethanicus]|uniref:DNA polymerase Y-family little finger domain-containing protein n=1 Tax=Ancylobacter dichloromethanicus TaxID=518825 RepID=A0A9W6MXS0_9HYPH|nr:hypothetical protein GCM10017643_02970 [Ancylobacter dichloromethanicus]
MPQRPRHPADGIRRTPRLHPRAHTLLQIRHARGIDERPVEPDRPRKSVGAENTFATDIFEPEAARAELLPLAAKVWRNCEAHGICGRTVMLKVKYADFQQITRSQTVAVPVTDQSEI